MGLRLPERLVNSSGWSESTRVLFGVVVLVWGLNYIFVDLGLELAGPLWLATLRAVLGLVGSALIVTTSGGWGRLDGRGRRDAFLIGLPNITAFFGLWFEAARSVLPGVTAVLIYTYPLWVAVFSAPLLAHRLTARHWVSILVGFSGVALISQIGSASESHLPVAPVLELLAAAVAWATATVAIQRRFRREEMLEANVYQLMGGVVGLLAFTLVLTPMPPDLLQPALWGTVVWLGLLGTAIAYSVWFDLLGRTRAATLSAYLFVVPVVALIASAVVFSERLSALQLVGVGFVLASIYGIASAPEARAPVRPADSDKN